MGATPTGDTNFMITSFLFAILLVLFVLMVIVIFIAGIAVTFMSFVAAMAGIGDLCNSKERSRGLKLLLGGFSSFVVMIAIIITCCNYNAWRKIGKVSDYLSEKTKPAKIQLENK